MPVVRTFCAVQVSGLGCGPAVRQGIALGQNAHPAASVAEVRDRVATWWYHLFRCERTRIDQVDGQAGQHVTLVTDQGPGMDIRQMYLLHEHRSILIGKPIDDRTILLGETGAVLTYRY